MARAKRTDTSIPTNLRPLMVLEAMAKAGVPVTPTEVNQDLGLPKPTIHRLFATLEAEGFIRRDIDGRGYFPDQRLRNMSMGILSSLRIRTARLAILTHLAEEIGETCNLAIPDRDAMIYLDRVETKWPLRIQLPIGSRVPFYCTASGKMYLSSLDGRHLRAYAETTSFEARTRATLTSAEALRAEIADVRARGYSVDHGEFMEDMIAVAVPVRDRNGRLMATLSFHAPEQRLSPAEAPAHVPALHRAAARLSRLFLEDSSDSDTGDPPVAGPTDG